MTVKSNNIFASGWGYTALISATMQTRGLPGQSGDADLPVQESQPLDEKQLRKWLCTVLDASSFA
jgi:hypothetical protein